MKIKNIGKRTLLNLCFPIFHMIYLEFVLHLLIYKSLTIRILMPIIFSIVFGLIIKFFTTFFGEKANKVIYIIITGFITLYFVSQFVYFSIFGSFFSVFQIKMGADAVTNFFDQLVYGIIKVFGAILLFLLPYIPFGILTKKKILVFEKIDIKKKVIFLICIFVAHLLCIVSLLFGGTTAYSCYDIYFDSGIGTDITVENLGLTTATRLELKNLMFPWLSSNGSLKIIGVNDDTDKTTEKTEPDETQKRDPRDKPKKKEFLYSKDEYNVLDIDFDTLIKYETDEDIRTLHKYFRDKVPSKKNEYTGMFKGYNLIVFCAESFSPKFITQNKTPTLYKMINNGIVFNNYFGSFESNTTNGEYSLCMGLFPDLSRDKVNNSFLASSNNYLPFTFAHMFEKQYGITSYAFHDYYGKYYQRNITHFNMGYEFIAPDNGLDMDVQWPSSDLEMIEASIDEYLTTEEPFHAYYMTFSGHYQYNWNNPMSFKNRGAVLNQGYENETVQAYVACNLEVEKALTYLESKLEEAGVADKTVIVLTNDHYPYGLSESEYNELAGQPIETTFEKYRNSFICYCPSIEEPIVCDNLCCTIDILPTMLNLFGFKFDSRLLLGVDALSDSDHVAILSNQSFIAKDMSFSSSRNRARALDITKVLDEKVEIAYKNYVKNIFTVSTAILNNDYYACFDYLFDDHVPKGNKTEIPYEELTWDTDETGIVDYVTVGDEDPDSPE